jgi:hypothetical protein
VTNPADAKYAAKSGADLIGNHLKAKIAFFYTKFHDSVSTAPNSCRNDYVAEG